MANLAQIRSALTAALLAGGVNAVDARPERERTRLTEAVATVELLRAESQGAGFCDYLGERENEAGVPVELYGRRLSVTFALEFYAPRDAGSGAAACHALFDQVTGVLQTGLPAGLRLRNITCAPVEFDRTLGLYHCRAEALCLAYLYAEAAESGLLLDFELKGVMTT